MAKKGIIKTVTNKAEEIAENHKKKKAIKQIKKEELALQQAKEEADRILAEKHAVQAEKEKLMRMSNQELLAEAILAIRGFYKDFDNLKHRQDELSDRLDSLESDISDMEYIDDGDLEGKIKQLQSNIEQLQYEINNK